MGVEVLKGSDPASYNAAMYPKVDTLVVKATEIPRPAFSSVAWVQVQHVGGSCGGRGPG